MKLGTHLEAVPGWSDEVETSVHPLIRDGRPVHPGLGVQEGFELRVHVLEDLLEKA